MHIYKDEVLPFKQQESSHVFYIYSYGRISNIDIHGRTHLAAGLLNTVEIMYRLSVTKHLHTTEA
jgi:hypothetical protein